MNIDAVFFDYGRVLSSFNHFLGCLRISRHSSRSFHPSDVVRIMFEESGLAQAHERGDINEREFFEKVKEILHIPHGLSFLQFQQEWGDIFTPNHGIASVLRRLVPDVQRYIVSNTEPIHWLYMEDVPVVRQYFPAPQQHILSFKVRARKPERAIYNEAFERANTLPKNVLYIDDIPKYVQAFKNMGGHGIVYNCTKDSICSLEQALESYGVLQ